MRAYQKQLILPFYALGFVYDPKRKLVLVERTPRQRSRPRNNTLVFFGDKGQQDQRPLDCFAQDACHHLLLDRESIVLALMKVSFSPDHHVQLYSYVLFLDRDTSHVGSRESSPYAWAALSEAVDFNGASFKDEYMREQLDALYQRTLHESPDSALKE